MTTLPPSNWQNLNLQQEGQETVFLTNKFKNNWCQEFGIDMYTSLYLIWITNKDLLYSTGNSAQYYVTT